MSVLAEAIAVYPATWLFVSGLCIGALFGALVQRTGYCAMGGVSDLVLFGDRRRLAAWLLSGAFAILLVQIFSATGLVDLGQSAEIAAPRPWAAHALGGVLFGIGMVLAGGCASRNVVRAGTGDLRAATVVVVVGLVAGAATSGALAPLRAAITGVATPGPADIPGLIEGLSGVPRPRLHLPVMLIVLVVLATPALMDRGFRHSRLHLASAIGVGAMVAAGWLATGLAADGFSLVQQRPASLTFVGPSDGVLQWLAGGASALPRFGVAVVLGTFVGAAIAAAASKAVRLAGFAGWHDAARALVGAAAMGFGGVIAGGCTIGQGVAGVSTLATGTFVTLVFLVVGGVVGVKLLQYWLDRET